MNERANPFATLSDPPNFTTKPKPEKPIPDELVARIAEEQGFPSRQAPKAKPRRKPRIHRTGRNVQFNAKVTAETDARIHAGADRLEVPLGEVLKRGMDALEREEGILGKP